MEGVAADTDMDMPSPAELISRARSMVPDLLARAPACEEAAAIPEETLGDFRRHGLIRVCMPRKYGGYEYGWDAGQSLEV